MIYSINKDYVNAKETYLFAAENGNSSAMFWLADIYRKDNECDKFKYWLLKAIENGNAQAMFEMGDVYEAYKSDAKYICFAEEKNKMKKKDIEQAVFDWYLKAAYKNYYEAIQRIIVYYEIGLYPANKNKDKVKDWTERLNRAKELRYPRE